MGRMRTLRLRKETLVELTDDELGFAGGDVVTEVGCHALLALQHALSLNVTCRTCFCPTGNCTGR